MVQSVGHLANNSSMKGVVRLDFFAEEPTEELEELRV